MVPRLEVFAMSFDNSNNREDTDMYMDTDTDTDTEDNPIDFKCGPYRIFISDQFRVLEIYNPLKLKDFYTDLPQTCQYEEQEELHDSDSSRKPELGDSISGHNTSLPLTCKSGEEEEELQDSGSSCNSEEDEEDSGSFGSSSAFISQPTDLLLTGPNGDIQPYDYFYVIVHQDTGIAEIDDSHLEQATPIYLYGRTAIPSDVVESWNCVRSENNDRPFDLKVRGPFGSLTLKGIVFERYSRLVTVGVKWLMEGIGGVDGKQNHATETYICGKLSFYSRKYKYLRSVLLETPEDKAVKVAHDHSIPLLRSGVAIPYCSSFTVVVSLRDPINNSAVKGHVTFDCDHFSENNGFYKSKDIAGSGAKIVVEVTMKPNDPEILVPNYLQCSPQYHHSP